MTKREQTCCFSGHRILPRGHLIDIEQQLTAVLLALISQGVRYFGVGGALGFDTLAAKTILKLREEYPHIKLILVQPCKTQTKGWSKEDIAVYEWICTTADKLVCLSEQYYRGCMHKRNRHLVNQSAHCICYLTEGKGGTAYTVNYAKAEGLSIINIADAGREETI